LYFYLISLLALSVTTGIQIVLLPWLVVDHFMLDSVWLGWLHVALLLPNLLFLIVGGAIADWQRTLNYLPRVIAVNAVLHCVVALLLFQNLLSMALLLVYALLLGLSNALIQPGREYLLKQLNPQGLQSLVAKSSICIYGGQAIGALCAASTQFIEIHTVFFLQALLVGVAVVLLWRLMRVEISAASRDPQETVFSLYKGLQDVFALPALRSLIAIVSFNGFFHMGVFIVALPILVQDVYQYDVSFFGLLQFTFLVGTLVASMVVVYRKGLDAPGKRIAFSLLYGGVILLALGAGPTQEGLFMLIFAWGVVVGISANMGRAIVQLLAPEESRGQIISIYQLALFGFAPLGALVGGYLMTWLGVLPVLMACGVCSIIMFAALLFVRSLWDVEVT
jgi:MFS family permease